MTTYSTYDLHNHTCWSYDASSPVERLFALAERRGVTHLAITDHHNCDAWDDVVAASRRHPTVLTTCAGEFTVASRYEKSIDLVCMNLPINQDSAPLAALRDLYHDWCHEAGRHMVRACQEAGYPMTEEEYMALIRTYRPASVLDVQGFTHAEYNNFCNYLSAVKGFFKTKVEASEFYMKVFPDYPAADAVLPLLRACGALVIFAHPYLYAKAGRDERGLDALREELGFDGMECAHSEIPAEMTPFYRNYCEGHHLLSSAGTDSHHLPFDLSTVQPTFGPGSHIGPAAWLDELKERVPFVTFA